MPISPALIYVVRLSMEFLRIKLRSLEHCWVR